jgi:hypothetical protein
MQFTAWLSLPLSKKHTVGIGYVVTAKVLQTTRHIIQAD